MKRMMKRSLVMALAAIFAVPAMPAMSDDGGDRALFYQNEARESAPIDRALAQIVPAPYRVYLDDSVPATLFLVWKQGDNWMEVLTTALAPVGLVAQPDWARNSITVMWRPQPAAQKPATAPAPAAVVAAPASPVRVSAQSPAREPVMTPQMTGSFEAVTAKRPAKSAPKEREEIEAEVIVASHTGRLPVPAEMWRLMKAAVDGKRIVLTGYSGVRDERRRTLLANSYANALRDKLLAIGFPASSTLVNEREEYKATGNRPRVEIAVISEVAL